MPDKLFSFDLVLNYFSSSVCTVDWLTKNRQTVKADEAIIQSLLNLFKVLTVLDYLICQFVENTNKNHDVKQTPLRWCRIPHEIKRSKFINATSAQTSNINKNISDGFIANLMKVEIWIANTLQETKRNLFTIYKMSHWEYIF